jgi:hypothetical protein
MTRASHTGQWIGLALGAPLAAVGVMALLDHADATHPVRAAAWIVGAALVHDLLLVPVVLVAGAVVTRAGGRSRPWISAGLVVSGPIALFAWPFVRGYGRLANNPSILPRNYGRGLAVTLLAVWLLVGVTAWRARRR